MDAQEIKTAVAHQEAARSAAEAPFVNLADPAPALGPDGAPAVSRRAPIWDDVPDEQWNDWRWQLSHRVNDLAEIEQVLELTDEERDGLSAPDKFRVDITPYFISLIDPNDPNDPIRRQVIPSGREHAGLHRDDGGLARRGPPLPGARPRPSLPGPRPDAGHDPVRELLPLLHAVADRRRPDPELQPPRPRGPARVPAPDAAGPRRPHLRRRRPDARARSCSRSILRGLREIPHIEIIRIGSRVPVFLPQRIDDELCEMLEKYHPLWINLHFNHPNEITPEVSRAVDKLTKAGLPVGNQSVLLAGVNDCVHIQRALVHKLVANRIRPYYLYQCDLVEGSGHFRTPVGKGLEIMEGLRGHTSGYAVPTYVIDAPGRRRQDPGHAQLPDLLLATTRSCCATTRATSRPTRSPRPTRSTTSSPAATASTSGPSPASRASSACSRASGCGSSRRGFEEIHSRGNTEAHRLQDPSKWVPFGVGAIEGTVVAGAPGARGRRRRRGERRRSRSTAPARSRGRARASRPRSAGVAFLLTTSYVAGRPEPSRSPPTSAGR